METGLSFTDLRPDSTDRFVPLRRELGVSTFGLNQIVLQPGERGRIHVHERQEEVFIVLEGTLTLLVDGTPHDLPVGRVVRVAPEVRRQLANYGPDRAIVLALGGALPHDGRDGLAFADWDAAEGAPPQDVPVPEDIPVDQRRTAAGPLAT
jgi:mannose-6-phosphate isomerase-like protein (cupin superfamily)